MTSLSQPKAFKWGVYLRYKIESGSVRAIADSDFRIYNPSDVEDLPDKLIEVLRGEDALLQFTHEYGWLGYKDDLVFTVQDLLRTSDEDNPYENWQNEIGGGEELCWIQAHARTILTLKHAAAFLNEPISMREAWRHFVKQHEEDCVSIHNQRLTQLIKLPVAANIEPNPENQLFQRGLPDETNARVLIAVLLENNLRRGFYPGFKVHLNGKPEIDFQFDSLINFIYWKLYEQMSTSLTRICPCGKVFQTQNAQQIHHDAQCTNRMNQRKYRERNRRNRQKEQ